VHGDARSPENRQQYDDELHARRYEKQCEDERGVSQLVEQEVITLFLRTIQDETVGTARDETR
jgi:hypothetical protein